jgi:uncharacterized protein
MSLCIHHDDLDGCCSAAIVGMFDNTCTFIEADYRRFPIEDIKKNEILFIVDYSPQPVELWDKVLEITKNVIWIDHHETAINASNEYLEKIQLTYPPMRGIRNTLHCGAWLTWDHCFPGRFKPSVLNIIDKWDRWVHEDNADILAFVAGMKVEDMSPTSSIWKDLLNNNMITESTAIQNVIRSGMPIRKFEIQQDYNDINKYHYTIEFEGYHCIVLNTTKSSSKIFENAHIMSMGDICIAWNFDGKMYTVHLYSKTVKVNDIAKKYGGGGHVGAAGFICEKLPWIKA